MSMLDAFLEVSYQEDQATSLRNEMAEAMTSLPTDMLHKLASGEEKLAFGHMEGGCWLDQFSGTALYDQAIQLEEQSINLQAQGQQQRSENRDASDQNRDAEDALRLRKKMLELDLRKGEAGGGEGGEEEPAEHEAMESPMEEAAEEEMKEGSALRSLLVQSMQKDAAFQEKVVDMRKEANEALLLGGGLGAGFGAYKAQKAGYGKEQGEAAARGAGGAIAGQLIGANLGALVGMAIGGGGPGAGGLPSGALLGASLGMGLGGVAGFRATTSKYNKKKGKRKTSSVNPDLVASMRMSKMAESQHHFSRATLGLPGTMAMQAAPGERMDAFKKGWSHTASDPMGGLKRVGAGGLGGAALGGLAGAAVPGMGAGLGARVGGLLGAGAGGVYHQAKMHHGEEGSKMLQAVKKKAKSKSKKKESSALPPALKAAKIPKGTDLDKDGKKNEGKEKSSAMIVADQWGRQMAHMDEQEKVAIIGALRGLGKGLVKAVSTGRKSGLSGLAMKGGAGAKGPVQKGWGAAAQNVGALGKQWAKKNTGLAIGMGAGAGLATGAALG